MHREPGEYSINPDSSRDRRGTLLWRYVMITKFALKPILWAAVIACFASTPAFAQITLDSYSELDKDGPLFSIDTINLASDSVNLSHLDVYVKFTNQSVQFIKVEKDKFRADYKITATVHNKDGEQVDSDSVQDAVFVQTFDQTTANYLSTINKVGFDLPPSEYEVQIQFEDLETQHKNQRKFPVTLRAYSQDKFMLSDILYLQSYELAENGRIVVKPAIFEEKPDREEIYNYFEIYNVPEQDSIELTYKIVDHRDKTVYEKKETIVSTGRITQKVIEVNSKDFPPGQFKMKITARYGDDEVKTERALQWNLSGMPDHFANLDEAIDVLEYIASKDEMKALKKADEDERHGEFIEFWKRRDPSPGTKENELMDEYYRRILFANDHFTSNFKDGWKTDMGMVYVKIGPPDHIERNPYNEQAFLTSGRTVKAYELWDYYRYNRQLVFLDENGFGEYRLANRQVFYDIVR